MRPGDEPSHNMIVDIKILVLAYCVLDDLQDHYVSEQFYLIYTEQVRDGSQKHLLQSDVESHTTVQPSPQMTCYVEFLKQLYSKHFPDGAKWPQLRTKKYINLAIIKKEKPSPHTVDEFTKATFHGGVDQIYKMKEPIMLDDLLDCGQAEMPKCILVQGAAGVGKSTFAWEICRQWKIKPSMQQFQLVQLVQLRHTKVHAVSSLEDLISVDKRDPNLVTSIAQELVERDGAGLLLILDGYDELPSAKQQNSMFAKLLKGEYLRKATIIVTFRPSVSSQIDRLCSDCDTMNIEILGFLQNNIQEYAECIYSQDKAMLASFLEYINSNPLISSMMHIPLNTAIVCELYKLKNTLKRSVPMTLTELYTELCFNLLYRYMKTQDLFFNEVDSVPDHILGKFACLPGKVKVQFDHLAEQAFGGVCNQRLIFNDLPDDFEHMGFMNKSVAVSALPLHKPSVSYNFFHLTLQEFLGAYHISKFPPQEQLEHVVSLIKNGNEVVLRFIAGLTQFKDISWEIILSHTGVHKDEEGISNCNSVVLNCLYEAHDPAFCAQVYPSGKVNYSPISATPFDLYALGYCIANSPCSWKICAIVAEGIAHIASGLKFQASVRGQIGFIKVSSEGHKIYNLAKLPVCIHESLTDLNLSHCGLDDSACNCLANIIPSFVNLRRLDISDNPFMPGGALRLFQALGHLKNFQYLDLLRAKLSMDDLQALSLLLRPNGTLESLVIGEQATSTDIVEHMVDIVLRDSSLHSLNFMNIDLAQVGRHLASKLKNNTTLLNLMVWDKSFCIEGAEAVVKALQENHTLRSLTLMPWYKQHIPHHILSSISGERIQWFIFPECKK